MKNKKIIIILTSLVVLIGGILFVNQIYNKPKNKKLSKKNNLAIMVKGESGEYVSSDAIPKGNYILNEDKTICENNGKVLNYDSTTGKISFSFLGSDRCTLYFDYKEKKGWETILLNNGGKEAIEAKGNPDFSVIATTNEGMYAAEDDLGTSYYFRGAVDNNWVKYGKYTKDMYNCNDGTISATDTGNSCTKIASSGDDIYWRIIRINGDSSIRMIYSGVTPPTESTKVIKTTDTSLGNSPFNENSDSAEYVGYMYIVGEQHGNSTDSTIKTYLDNWYANYTDLNADDTKITDQIYCNDRNVISGTWSLAGNSFEYAAYTRLYGNSSNSSPSLKCTTESDKFTVNSSNGNGALTYPVGLITADEINLAGADNQINESPDYYLYIGELYWPSSPSMWDGTFSYSFFILDSGILYGIDYNLGMPFGVRGVVSLSSETKLSGDGTWNNVYEVS